MKFKEYLKNLKEYAVKSGQKEWEMMLWGYLPLKSSLLDTMMYFPKAYRISGPDALKWLVKDQNKKRQVPCFTKGSKGIEFGAVAGNEFLVELNGYSAFEAPIDIMSQISRNGYRWLVSGEIIEEFSKKIIPKREKYFLDNFNIPESKIKDSELWTQKAKKEFIKWYFDETKQILKDEKILYSIKKNLLKMFGAGGDFNNNEIFLEQYTITGAWVLINKNNYYEDELEIVVPELNKILEKLKIKNCGLLERKSVRSISKTNTPKCKGK